MSWQHVTLHQITCDGPCRGFGPASPTRAEAAREAAVEGWLCSGPPLSSRSRWHCPECKTVADLEEVPQPCH